MKITFLGAGSAFTMKSWQTNILIEEKGMRLLLDCGSDIRFALRDAGLSYKDIDAVYISHLHGDHVGGTEYLGFCSYFDPNRPKPKLFAHQNVVPRILPAGMESLEGLIANIYTFFDVNSLGDNAEFLWQGIRFEIVQSVHIMNGHAIIPSFGLIIHSPTSTKTIYWTADSQYAPSQLIKFYNDADMIWQDCETYPFKSRVHAHRDDLTQLPANVKEKMLLQHVNDNILEANGMPTAEALQWAKDTGFLGIAYKGMTMEW
jgi:ribonuclease BN (tRNA processing enzyme)